MDEQDKDKGRGGERIRVELGGVPETLLWNLYQRSVEAARPGGRVLDDPRAVELVERIDYPFSRFAGAGLAQWHALRIACLDAEVRRFLAAHPGGTVVALGEGLETQFWRVDDGLVRWLSVDLPETVAVRDRLLPDDPPRRRTLACSALDLRWMDEVEPGTPPQNVLVTAQGLLMYLPPRDVRKLIARCAERFPGGSFLFDAVPRAMVARSRAAAESGAVGGGGYRAPAWQWGMNSGEYRKVAGASPRIAEVRRLALPRGRGLFAVAPVSHLVPGLRSARMSVVAVRFGPADYRNGVARS
ncbi:class I SAM-dependent methyltransferase [Streptomyces sp. NPDC020983]|uniref:class I SAM-dependent methyltransferase n=1 Tax=Streptomyces sp. NPDC020983 TaxID=3365106 RepID=UPI0037941819